MSEPDFRFFTPPDFLLADVDERIVALRSELQHRNPTQLLEPLRRLTRIRGTFAFDLISSIAWAAGVMCGTAAEANRALTSVEMRSLERAIESMDRARHTALLEAAS